MTNAEFLEIFSSLDEDMRNEIGFKALGGKKRKGKYVIDTYYKGLGYYVGGWYADELSSKLDEMEKEQGKHLNWSDIPEIKKAKEKYGVNYTNDIMSGDHNNPFVQFFVCSADDVSFSF